MGQEETKTLGELNALGLNNAMLEEVESIKYDMDTALAFVSKHVDGLRHAEGRKVRKERLFVMKTVLSILYDHVLFSQHGECTPSMRRMAFVINPLLKPALGDDKKTLRRKERSLGNLMMSIQRAVSTLVDFGIIKIHLYRSASNQDLQSYPNFFYELLPISSFCPDFAIYIRRETQAVFGLQKIILGIKEHLLRFEKISAAVDGVKPKAWEFPESRLEKWVRSCGVFALG